MNDLVTCPKCGDSFQLSLAMQTRLAEETDRIRSQAEQAAKERFDRQAAEQARASKEENDGLRKKVEEAAKREAEVLRTKRELEEKEQRLTLELETKLAAEKERIRTQAEHAAKERFDRQAAEQARASKEENDGLRKKVEEAAKRDADVLRTKRELEEKEQRLTLELETKLAAERERIRTQAEQAAKERFDRQVAEQARASQEENDGLRKKVEEAAKRDADVLRTKRELEEKEQRLTLELETKLASERERIRAQAEQTAKERLELQVGALRADQEEALRLAQEAQRLKEEEHRQQSEGLKKQVEELQKKLVQGSQQTQGEAQEEVLKDLLSTAFPADAIEDVAKGEQGADLLQRVDGGKSETILWESKRTKNWSDGWLTKLRDDQREAGAACCVIVSQALPSDIRFFGERDGVWICAFSHAQALATVLRAGLKEVARARRVAENRGEKAHQLYDYLTGPEFKNRIEGVVEPFTELMQDLTREKSAMQRLWKKREHQLQRALQNLSSVFGSVQGYTGKHLGDLEALALPAPAEDADAEDDSPEGPGETRPEDPQLMEILFGLVPEDGTPLGNKTVAERFKQVGLRALQLVLTDQDYDRCKEGLLGQGRIQRGKGRGGAVSRVRQSPTAAPPPAPSPGAE